MIASTLVQIPRSLVKLDKSEVESLARRCVRISRAKMQFIQDVRHCACQRLTCRNRSLYEALTVRASVDVLSADLTVVISYLEAIVHLLLGNNTAHVMAVATANHLALSMRLNEESVSECSFTDIAKASELSGFRWAWGPVVIH